MITAQNLSSVKITIFVLERDTAPNNLMHSRKLFTPDRKTIAHQHLSDAVHN